MKAVIFSGPEQVEVTQVAEPRCQADEVVIKVARVGLCGTDLHIYHNEYMSHFPVIGGHEFCGTIVEVGAAVVDFHPGQRVAADPNLYCGHCDFCRDEKANHCLNWEGVGITRPGAFAEFVAVPARACYRLPEGLTDLQGAFIEPVSCVAHAMNRLRVWPGDEVLILGAGPMGLILSQVLRHSGAAQVVVVEKQPARLELAARLGATLGVPVGPGQNEALREIAPYGFSIVIDATGNPRVIESAFQYLKPRGQYLQFGVASKDAEVKIRPYEIFKNDWTILGSFALCYTFQPAIAWLMGGVVDVNPLVSHTLTLDEFPKGLAEFEAGRTLKVQLVP
jgi:2-desacetyl-2-hydroxyethyl bacteriochlorophyllide A dehydrogenase